MKVFSTLTPKASACKTKTTSEADNFFALVVSQIIINGMKGSKGLSRHPVNR